MSREKEEVMRLTRAKEDDTAELAQKMQGMRDRIGISEREAAEVKR